MYAYIYIYTDSYVFSLSTYIYIYTHILIHTFTHTHTSLSLCYICYIYIHICIHTYIHDSNTYTNLYLYCPEPNAHLENDVHQRVGSTDPTPFTRYMTLTLWNTQTHTMDLARGAYSSVHVWFHPNTYYGSWQGYLLVGACARQPGNPWFHPTTSPPKNPATACPAPLPGDGYTMI